MSTPNDVSFFNVWLVSQNRVYRGVPYSVVCDWIQEGRLTGKDCVKAAQDANWIFIQDHDLLKPYLMQPESTPRADDEADALEPIEMDISAKKHVEHEEEDPDMIPLIDISMVLLVFFMMTAQDLLTASPIDSPKASAANIAASKEALKINLRRDPDNANVVQYYWGDDVQPGKERKLEDILSEVDNAVLNTPPNSVTVIVRAEGKLPYSVVQTLVARLKDKKVKVQAHVKQQSAEPGADGGAP